MVRPVDTKVLSSVIDGMNERRASTVDLPAVLVRDLRNNSNRQQGSQSYLSCLIVLALIVMSINDLMTTFNQSLFTGESTTASVVHSQCARSTELSAQPLC